jgi:hypothetical protein
MKDKLTETLNAIKISSSLKNRILKIADIEGIQIQQVCRKLLDVASKEYFDNPNFKLTDKEKHLNK